jgi:hypothetical protein
MGRSWRVGGHHGVTIIEFDPADKPDDQGRRPSDSLVAVVTNGSEDFAAEIVFALGAVEEGL